MIWTLLILVIAIALYFGCGYLLYRGGKKQPSMGMLYAKKAAKFVAIVLLVIGVNRLGLGTTYYLTEANPMILQTMAQNMQNQNSGASNKEIKSYVRKNMADMTKNAPIAGNENAKNTIFLFTAYSCPYCTRVHNELMRVIAERDDVRVVIKNFSIHGVLSDDAARATIAAKMQTNDLAAKLDLALAASKYWPDNMDNKSQEELAKIINKEIMARAAKVGLNVEQLQKDMNSATVQQELAQVRELAQKFNIQGTPFLIINDKAFPGAIPYEQIVNALK
ncbi:MAG: thioredoxin domain-containing protein [Alphaproteobacteria bacterium]|nr:thioredoxin domain-containing protein [Alphaproteobacteria bacterium]